MKDFKQNISLAPHTSFGIGGRARYFIEVESALDMRNAILRANQMKIPFHILGRGSNTLFDDRGFDGLVILNKINFCNIEGEEVHVGAGYNFSLLGIQTARQGLSGLEFASGIPGTVGGAIFMNAGAGGPEACDILLEVGFVDESGTLRQYKRNELEFAYRYSQFHKMRGAIVSARFALTKCRNARKKQLDIVDYRLKTQPYKDKTAGCVFRNPEGTSAGKLIQESGLKGARKGGAEVSPMHANFIVNRDGATQKDVLLLAKLVKERVKIESGYDLELELRTIDFSGVKCE